MFKNGARWLVPALAVMTLLTACGSANGGVVSLHGGEGDSSATPGPSVDPEEAIFEFAACMREHGIDLPDPQVATGASGGGVGFTRGEDSADAPNFDPNSAEFQAAMDACREFLKGFAGDGGQPPPLSEDQQQAMIDFADCMREHGIDLPDPQDGGFLVVPAGDGDGAEPAFDPLSKEFQAAQEACADILGDFGPGQQVSQ